jgi:hypothetical protein
VEILIPFSRGRRGEKCEKAQKRELDLMIFVNFFYKYSGTFPKVPP